MCGCYDGEKCNEPIDKMLKRQNEIRMIWLMVLIIVAVSAWFSEIQVLTYACGIAFVMSVMQYADGLHHSVDDISNKTILATQPTSKVPLYIASIFALTSGLLEWHFGVTLGIGMWIFFFLRWLKRIENSLIRVELKLKQQPFVSSLNPKQVSTNVPALEHPPLQNEGKESLSEQVKQWIFQGNPVLKVAILVLVVGIILLLRFATEHWQLSLAMKLGVVALISTVISTLGYVLYKKNRSFALALEGLGLAGLFLTIFFAYYNAVIPNIIIASICFVAVIIPTLWLSLKQQSVELAIMAMMVAYSAPFTLPIREATAVEFVAYYLVINIAVAILSTLRPWKFLNQIAFLMTIVLGGGYAFYKGYITEKIPLTLLVLAHSAVFIWLGFRFSQLLAKADVQEFKLKPALDVALIFGAPIVAYAFLYVMYFDETFWQAGFSFIYALLFAGLYLLAKRSQIVGFISQSYLSLALIFLALIPPILLPDQWSIMGWAIEGLVIYIFALYRQSAISRYLAMGLLIIAGLSSLYFVVELNDFPSPMYWVLSLCYLLVVVVSNIKEEFQQQLTNSTITFHCFLTFFTTILLMFLLQEELSGNLTDVLVLLIIGSIYFVMNELLLAKKATWSWLIPKWLGLIPVYLYATALVIGYSEQGYLVWDSLAERVSFTLLGLLLTILWLRPFMGVRAEKEWVSLGALSSLALASLTIFPSMPFISMVILPLVFCAWCYWKVEDSEWKIFWQARSTLLITMAWIICSQLLSQQVFYGYVLPILNPFDLVSLAILASFIWMLSLQIKTGLDKGMVAVLMILSLLWLSSYIVLRALHFYLETPFNELAIWNNAIIQLSLTLLWVSLAFITMSIASRKNLRAMWVLGGSILVIVTLKLVLFDLSHIGTLTRVISFLGAGFIMLIIAYIAPMPETEKITSSS